MYTTCEDCPSEDEDTGNADNEEGKETEDDPLKIIMKKLDMLSEI